MQVGYCESSQKITAPTMDMHRAIASLVEKLEALDRCNQRLDACTDSSLVTIIEADREREKKQVAMLLEWMRRHDPKLDHALRGALFKAGPIVEE